MGPQYCLDHGEHGHRPAPSVQLCRLLFEAGGFVRSPNPWSSVIEVILDRTPLAPPEPCAHSGLSW